LESARESHAQIKTENAGYVKLSAGRFSQNSQKTLFLPADKHEKTVATMEKIATAPNLVTQHPSKARHHR